MFAALLRSRHEPTAHWVDHICPPTLRRGPHIVARPGFGYPQEGFVVRDGGKRKVAPVPAAVAEVVEELAGVEPVEECAAGIPAEMAPGAEIGHRLPVGIVVQRVPGADFEQDRHVAVFAQQVTLTPVRMLRPA